MARKKWWTTPAHDQENRPTTDEKRAVGAGDLTKFVFHERTSPKCAAAERMWVEVESVNHKRGTITGTLENDPLAMDSLRAGQKITLPLANMIPASAAGHGQQVNDFIVSPEPAITMPKVLLALGAALGIAWMVRS